MKKLILGIAVLFLIVYGIFEFIERLDAVENNESGVKYDQQLNQDQPDQPGQPDEPKKPEMLTITPDQAFKGNLLLINRKYPVPDNAELPEIVNLFKRKDLLKGFGILDNSIELPLDMVDKFSNMVQAAKKDGVTHFLISSGYRDNEKQQELYETLEKGVANPPGHSEHNLGLSMDIGSSLGMMKDAPEGKWLEQNAWKYGFILRFPEDKKDITGVMYEPWHFRYVGLPHSAIMQKHDFVLEQYLDYLKEKKEITETIDGQTYSIAYYRVSDQNIEVPLHQKYELSGDNVDGVIMTSWDTELKDAPVDGTKTGTKEGDAQ